MKKRMLLFLICVLCMVVFWQVTSLAYTEGDYTYEVYDNTARITRFNTNVEGEIVIPSTLGGYPVLYIEDGAFKNCKKLTKITISEGIKGINYQTFMGCTLLKEVVLPESLEFGNNCVFQDCISLTDINIPGKLDSVAGWFDNCTSLETIVLPDNIKNINFAFERCTALKNVTLPSNLSKIQGTAFSGCSALETISIPETVTEIGQYVFKNCSSLKEIIIPDSVKKLGNDVFYGCTSLTKVIFPKNLEIIESCAFKKCSGMKEFNLPQTVTEIGYGAFEECTSLEEIEIPSGIEKIPFGLFENCTSLKKVTLPSSIRGTIESSAFSNCTSLETITIPEGVTQFDYGVFKNCSSLKQVSLPDTLTKMENSCFENCVALETIEFPDDIKSIPSYSFSGCSGLKSVTLPKRLTKIDYNAFYQCSALTEINFNQRLKKISEHAFYGCSSLEKITLPESLEKIAYNAFSYCTKLNEIKLGKNIKSIGGDAFSNTAFYQNQDNWENGVLYIGSYLIIADKNISECEIKEGTTLIAAEAFYGNKKLKALVLPSTVRFVCNGAFVNSNIASFDFPDTIEQIEESIVSATSFYNNAANWDGYLLYIGKYLVDADRQNAKGEIVIKEGTKIIAGGVFNDGSYAYDRITKLSIPDSVIYIGDNAFGRLRNVEEIIIPEDVVCIGENAFRECTKMKSIVIPKSVREIGYCAFTSEYLEKITVLNPLCIVDGYINGWDTVVYGYEDTDVHREAIESEREFIPLNSGITVDIKRNGNVISCENINVSDPSKGGAVMVSLNYRYGPIYDFKTANDLTNGSVTFEFEDDIVPDDLYLKFFWWATDGTIMPLSPYKPAIID